MAIFDLELRVNRGKGFEPLIPYEGLHRVLKTYTSILEVILKDFDARLEALEQAGRTRNK